MLYSNPHPTQMRSSWPFSHQPSLVRPQSGQVDVRGPRTSLAHFLATYACLLSWRTLPRPKNPMSLGQNLETCQPQPFFTALQVEIRDPHVTCGLPDQPVDPFPACPCAGQLL